MNAEKVLVESLHKYALKNKVFDAVCHVWALRQRSRRQVTVAGLMYAMKRDGFTQYSKAQYKEVLAFLASVGVGRLNSSGTALLDVKISLQSLGQATLTVGQRTSNLKQHRNPALKFKKLHLLQNAEAASTTAADIAAAASEALHVKTFIEPVVAAETPRPGRTYPAFLTVLIEGKPIKFKASDNITADNLMQFLTQFKEVVQ